MKKEIKTLWVAALRGEEYEQGTAMYAMHTSIGNTVQYDPLGVLCALAVKAELPIKTEEKESKSEMAVWDTYYDGQNLYLPQSVIDWAGLKECDPHLQMEDGVYEITYINDFGDYVPFSKFADLIETQL